MQLKGLEKNKKQTLNVPDYLIYEMRRGVPIYYRDYDKVLKGEKTAEEVMGSGFLHAFVLTAILRFLIKELEPKGFQILTGEVGFKFAPKSWYNLDIAIFEKGQLKEVKEGFLTTPPKIVIEIDTKADLRRFSSPSEYFHTKTQDLLDAGVEKVLWVFTKEKKVWLAKKGKRWIITDWNDEIELTDGVKLNLKKITEGV